MTWTLGLAAPKTTIPAEEAAGLVRNGLEGLASLATPVLATATGAGQRLDQTSMMQTQTVTQATAKMAIRLVAQPFPWAWVTPSWVPLVVSKQVPGLYSGWAWELFLADDFGSWLAESLFSADDWRVLPATSLH